MTNMTCFWHPLLGYHDLEDSNQCETCGRRMDHFRSHPPQEIRFGDRVFAIIGAIDRGFYSATYAATEGRFARQYCLKVIPRQIYEMRDKDFSQECEIHHEIAQGTQHVVDIEDYFDAEVHFGDDEEPLDCHVAVLQYVPGESLRRILERQEPISAQKTAQIAVDLLGLLQELSRKQVFHNDLHAGNVLVRTLPPEQARLGAADPHTLAIAVDFGSVGDASRSTEGPITGDSHHVTTHLMELALRVTPDPATADDTDFRLALALHDIANLLKPDSADQRTPNYDDLIALVFNALYAASSPWAAPSGGLTRFSDSFNAQTMRPWFVPKLLVDPGDRWQEQLKAPGPLVVTGMRGCGKTMLLRALQFHARASATSDGAASRDAVAEALKADGYVGLYVSCNRLLDNLGRPDGPLHEPFTRLFLSYAKEALQALRHLEAVAGKAHLSAASPRPIIDTVNALVTNADLSGMESAVALERRLHVMLRSLESGESTFTLSAHPSTAMPQLAEAVLACTEVWAGSRVLFLLDDVSTRHLREDAIRDLLSRLMFASDVCAFKVTTEAQTLELILMSPGLVERARIGRDLKSFDLASEINLLLKRGNGRNGREFVSQVLQKRARLLSTHPLFSPEEILGDQRLVAIAEQIVNTSDSSPDRKNVYWGLSALAAVCVGDIGDVISIYEMVIDRASPITSVPVAARHQSSAFHDYCSRLLYHLNRREGRLKDFSDGFAAAAHDLLMQSAHSNPRRLRDYASVYVRITSGDPDRQFDLLRELIDAGVFVLNSGPDVPRTKTRDSNPMSQYILTYRKLLGISNHIGLSQRDRFEVSGDKLSEWLENPKRGRDILKSNLASAIADELVPGEREADGDGTTATGSACPGGAGLDGSIEFGGGPAPRAEEVTEPRSPDSRIIVSEARAPRENLDEVLFNTVGTSETDLTEMPGSVGVPSIPMPDVREISPVEVSELDPVALVAGRGFEDRAVESVRSTLSVAAPERVDLVVYPLTGTMTAELDSLLIAADRQVARIPSTEQVSFSSEPETRPTIVDVTGLSKNFIFPAVRSLLIRDRRVIVCHTEALEYYPLDADVESRLTGIDDDYTRLEACKDILTGERGPYEFVPLQVADADDGRRRMLLASSSAKHERLLSLLEMRDPDHLEVLVPPVTTPRSRLARLAGEVAGRDYHSSRLTEVETSDMNSVIETIATSYRNYYSLLNYNVEVGLTGSKLHAVALAAASTRLKFGNVWYVRPHDFDPHRFTRGTGATHYYLLEARDSGASSADGA